jgi:predicted ATPase/DNA-binding SARP family transcriptional activator
MGTIESNRAGTSTAVQTVQVRLLGTFEVDVDGRPVPGAAWRLRKASELVRILSLAPGHRVHRETLMEQLWPDRPLEAASNNLHQAIRVARAALGQIGAGDARTVVLRDGSVNLLPGGAVWVDAAAFTTAIREAGDGPDELAALLAARELYRGEPLSDDRYADWAAGIRESLAQDHLSLLARIAELQAREGRADAAIDALRELLDLDPTDESAHRHLMRLYALHDRRQLALRQFERLRSVLARELEVEPSEASRQLYRDILEGRLGPAEAQAAPETPGPGGATDLPTERLADPAAPPVRRRTRPPRSHNLPVQLSSFVGREREVRQIERLLQGARALTLTGPGGTGKTRLAIEAASTEIGTYRDGVWLVELAAVSEPALVIQAIADVFDIREWQAEPYVELVAEHLVDRQVLLVLDNCEHLVDACAAVAQTLLRSCPGLKILATSRQALRIPGEVVLRVPSLPVPDPDALVDLAELGPIASVRLFVERAQAVDPTFALTVEDAPAVARLCHHLDGLPLAIELAASRVAVLPVGAIADRLDQRFALLVGGSRTALSRQQTLKATLDWSYNLLTEPQQRMLRLLSVFVGGAPLDAVEAIRAQTWDDAADTVALLADLVDQSLVTLDDATAQPRYRMLETVREYGRDRLGEQGERVATEAAHAAWALGLAEQAQSELPRPAWQASFERLEVEHDNLRAALDRSLSADPDQALRLASLLWEFWLWHGYLVEGRRWLTRVLDRSAAPTPTRAKALVGLAALAIRSGDTGLGAGRAGEAVEIDRGLGDLHGACRALQVVATSAWSEDDLASAERDYRECLEMAREAGYRPGQGAALNGLAVVRWYAGDHDGASRMIDDSLAMFRELADSRELAPTILGIGEVLVPQPEIGTDRLVFQETFVPFQDVTCEVAAGYALANRGMIRRVVGELEAATRDMTDALDLFRTIGDERAIAHALGRLGNLATAEGDFAVARERLEACLAIRRRIGDSRGTGLAQGNLGNLAVAEGDPQRARILLEESAAGFRRRGDMWGYGAALGNLASLAIAEGDLGRARRSLEESVAVNRTTGRNRWTAWALVQLVAVMRLGGELDPAAGLLDEALATFRRLDDRQGEAACLALGLPDDGRARRPARPQASVRAAR